MSNVVDFLERMGSDAHWRHAPADEIEQALVEADIELEMRSAILASNVSELQALLGQVKLMDMQTPGPSPEEIPEEPEQPEDPAEEEEEGDTAGTRQSDAACDPVPALSLSRS